MISNNFKLKKIGSISFQIGIFLLPSIFFFSAILILISSIISSFTYENKYWEDNWNRSIIICGLLIILSTFTHLMSFANPYSQVLNSELSLIGIFNWIPFFWLFWTLPPYLNSAHKRRKIALLLISGTFPVLVSGFGQYFFDWTGPLETLNGLIIW